jgi:hypothetical protein
MRSKDAVEFKGKRDDAALDRRYGKIGIPAVAAALPYQGDGRNPSEAERSPQAAEPSDAGRWLTEQAA